MTATRVLINGISADSVSAHDRGFHYGDGVFETVAVRNGAPLLWERHYRRLRLGAERLSLPPPGSEFLLDEVTSFCKNVDRGVLKIIYTRGVSGRGYRIGATMAPARALYLYDWPGHDARDSNGIQVRVCRTRLGHNPALAGIKHLNRLEHVLARNEWTDEYREGLMLDEHDNVIEATAANLFAVIDEALVTPDLSRCGVAGVMRELVLEQAVALGISCRVAPLSLSTLRTAQEMFLTNSIVGILPVTRLEDTTFRMSNIAQTLRQKIERADGVA